MVSRKKYAWLSRHREKEQADTLPDATFEEAGGFALFIPAAVSTKSRSRYIQRKELKKPPKAKPGFVIYHTHYSMMCVPDISGIVKQ